MAKEVDECGGADRRPILQLIAMSVMRGCGGIGRRAGFKIRFLWSVGSSPTTRTILTNTGLQPIRAKTIARLTRQLLAHRADGLPDLLLMKGRP